MASSTQAPRISVVLPTFNRARTLPRAIRSVLAQTLTDLELIVIDDGSSDDTAAVVAAIDDPRLRYLPLPRNGGVSAARNAGVEAARASWVAFQDSDDEWPAQRLQRQWQALEQLGPDYGVVMCCTQCPEDPAFACEPLPGRAVVSDAADITLRRLPGAPCWLARKVDLERAGLFDCAFDCFEDWELALRLSERTRIGLLNEALHINHRTPGSLFSNEAGYVRNLSKVLERHAAKWQDSRHARDLAMYQTLIGHMACLHGSTALGRSWFRRAIATAPLAPRAWISLGMSYLGRPVYREMTEAVRRRRQRRNGVAVAP